MKILVTGGAGFIGSNLVAALIDAGHEVAVVDNLSTGFKENINKKAKFFEVDICDRENLESVFEKEKPEIIFHLAAQISVRDSFKDPVGDIKNNLIGTVNLLLLAEKYEIKKIIMSSTGGAIYGDDAERPTPETAKGNPVSPYGMNKLSAEKYLEFFAFRSQIKTTVLRYANVYGPRQNPEGEAGVVAILASAMLRNGPIQIYGSGEQTRDFVFVSDVVEANLKALHSTVEGTFNIGTGTESSINEVAEKMIEISLSKSILEHTIAKPGEQMHSSLDCKKARLELGWQPAVSLEDGLRKTIEWFSK